MEVVVGFQEVEEEEEFEEDEDGMRALCFLE